jgi:Fe2+ transport system protein FeoA
MQRDTLHGKEVNGMKRLQLKLVALGKAPNAKVPKVHTDDNSYT